MTNEMNPGRDGEIGVAVSLIEEELSALLLLAGYRGDRSVIGPAGFQTIDDEGFDVGMRGLLARDLVAIGGQGSTVSTAALDIARLLCEPTHCAYLYLVEGDSFSAALLMADATSTVAASPLGPGAYALSVRPRPLFETAAAMIRDQVPAESPEEWPVGVRFHPFDTDPVDIAIGASSWGLVTDGQPQVASWEQVLDALRSVISSAPASRSTA